MNEGVYDLVIAGGGLGGCAAAMSACERGMHVLMTEETGWIGGQVSSQGVPPDEHQWIEAFGATKRYRHYRSLVRRTYNQTMKTADGEELLNPGKGLVSSICHDPRVTHHVLNEMLLPYMLTGQLTILRDTQVVSVTRECRAIRQASIKNKLTGTVQEVSAAYFIDATETGELLPLAGLSYVTGAESKADTQEPHARDEADPHDIQAFTYVLGMEYREGEDHTISKPDMYDFWKAFHPEIWPEPYLGLYAPHPITKERRKYTVFREKSGYPLWEYRRIFSKDQFLAAGVPADAEVIWVTETVEIELRGPKALIKKITEKDIIVTMDFSSEELGSVNKVPKITLGSAYSEVGTISVSSVIATLQLGEDDAAKS